MRASSLGAIITWLCARGIWVSENASLRSLRHKLFPRDFADLIEHALVQNFSGSDLLLDHVEPCLFKIHLRTFLWVTLDEHN
ncbi:MAG: hypothetical protein ACREYF_13060, partial [Gammaproteobacteria bacterium]